MRPRRWHLILPGLLAAGVQAEPMFQSGFEGDGPCMAAAATGEVNVDVPSVLITPQFRLNGALFPNDNTRYARIYLADSDGYQVLLGSTYNPAPPGVRLVPGVYDVVYEYVTGAGIPINRGARLRRNLWLGSDGSLPVDVASIELTGDFRHNGATFPGNATAQLELEGIYYGGIASLGSTSQQQPQFALLPGAYRLIYRHDAGSGIPENLHARLDRHDLDASATHVFDVPSVLVNVTFSLNGGAFPGTAYERGVFSLGGPQGDVVDLADSLVTTVQRRIVPNVYDVHWQRAAGGGVVPINDDAIVFAQVDLTDDASIAADVATVDVSGEFSVNGSPAPATAYESGEVFVVDPLTGARTTIGATYQQQYAARLVAQPYAIGYRHVNGSTILPSNPDTIIAAGWNAPGAPQRDIDIPVGTYHAIPTLNGAAFSGSAYESGSIFLQPVAGGPPTILGGTYLGAFDRRLLPGSYVAVYRHDSGTIVPRNQYAPIPGVRAIAAGSAGEPPDAIDVESLQMAGVATLDGAAFPAGNNARFHWRHRSGYGDDYAYWGDSSAGSLSVDLVAGSYDLMYEHVSGTAIAQNTYRRLVCWNIQPP